MTRPAAPTTRTSRLIERRIPAAASVNTASPMMSVGTEPNFVPRPGVARRTQAASTMVTTAASRAQRLGIARHTATRTSTRAVQNSARAELPMP